MPVKGNHICRKSVPTNVVTSVCGIEQLKHDGKGANFCFK